MNGKFKIFDIVIFNFGKAISRQSKVQISFFLTTVIIRLDRFMIYLKIFALSRSLRQKNTSIIAARFGAQKVKFLPVREREKSRARSKTHAGNEKQMLIETRTLLRTAPARGNWKSEVMKS